MVCFADYDFYVNAYHGTMEYEEFSARSAEAHAYLNMLTRGRISEASYEVKMAECAIADVVSKQAHDEDAEISSESVGNHSRTYSTSKKTAQQRDAEKLSAAKVWLWNTGLLYKGLR